MAPQAKRRRTPSEGLPQSTRNESEPFPAIEDLKPHEFFQLEDASMVLATDVHLYRVHRSILAKNSTAFKDMLDFPTGGGKGMAGDGANVDRWDGLPLVRMAGDDDESVYHLLMTLYDREYYRSNKPTTLQIIFSLLHMSTKYDFAAIRREVIQQLEHHYPSDSSKWFREEDNSLLGAMETIPDDFSFQLLAAARKYNLLTVLPPLFYDCAIRAVPLIFEYGSKLENEDLIRIVAGRERLSKCAYEFAVQALFPQERCHSLECMESRATMIIHWMNFSSFSPPEFPLDACEGGLDTIGHEEDRANICTACREKSTIALKDFRRTFWEDLPVMFDLEIWGNLKNAQS